MFMNTFYYKLIFRGNFYMINKLVSLIFPVYNVENYVRESLLSLLNQSYSNIEVIVVNDGTRDDSIGKIQDLVQSDDRVKLFNQVNSGLSAARNLGLKLSKGDYVAFIDSDDILDPKHIDTLIDIIDKHQLLAAHSSFERTSDLNRHGKSDVSKKSKCNVIKKSILLKKWAKRSLKIHLCSFLFNREFLVKNELFFDESLRFGEDNNYLWKLFIIVPNVGQTNIRTYKYLIRSNSLMSNQQSNRILYLMHKQVDLIGETYSRGEIDLITRNTAITRLFFSLNLSFAMNSIKSDFDELFKEMISKYRYVYSVDNKTYGLTLLLLKCFRTSGSLYLLANLRKML